MGESDLERSKKTKVLRWMDIKKVTETRRKEEMCCWSYKTVLRSVVGKYVVHLALLRWKHQTVLNRALKRIRAEEAQILPTGRNTKQNITHKPLVKGYSWLITSLLSFVKNNGKPYQKLPRPLPAKPFSISTWSYVPNCIRTSLINTFRLLWNTRWLVLKLKEI